MKYIISALLLVLSVATFCILAISDEVSNCLYQPSLMEVPPLSSSFQVYHYVDDDIFCDPYCDHGCSTSDGTIIVSLYDSSDTLLYGPYDMTNDSSDDCWTHWKRDIGDDLTGADYAIFEHVSVLGCYARIDIDL